VARLREGAPARVLEPATPARHGERHLRGLRTDAELAEQATEQRVVPLVVDEEARVQREPVAGERVRVAAGKRRALEDLDLVRLPEHVGRGEPGDPCADDGDPHPSCYSNMLEDRLPGPPA